jgi:hypothetical protein
MAFADQAGHGHGDNAVDRRRQAPSRPTCRRADPEFRTGAGAKRPGNKGNSSAPHPDHDPPPDDAHQWDRQRRAPGAWRAGCGRAWPSMWSSWRRSRSPPNLAPSTCMPRVCVCCGHLPAL